MNHQQRETVIEPVEGWFSVNFVELWAYRDLLKMFVKRDLISRYKQTVLGPLWFVLQPLLTACVFWARSQLPDNLFSDVATELV